MDNITLGQIVGAIGTLGIILGVIYKIFKFISLQQEQKRQMLEAIQNLSNKLDETKKEINQNIADFKFEQIKMALINYMCLVETVGLTEEQRKNAHDLFDKYTAMGGNSWVHDKWNKLVEENKI